MNSSRKRRSSMSPERSQHPADAPESKKRKLNGIAPTSTAAPSLPATDAPPKAPSPERDASDSSTTLDGDTPPSKKDKGKGKAVDPILEEVELLKKELASKTKTLESITQSLNCHICMDMLETPYALAPCGHVSCYKCLVRWFTNPPDSQNNDERGQDMPAPAEDSDRESFVSEQPSFPDDPPRYNAVGQPKTCPQCRGAVTERPVLVYVLKDVLWAIGRASGGANGADAPDNKKDDAPDNKKDDAPDNKKDDAPKDKKNKKNNRKHPRDPWDGIFPPPPPGGGGGGPGGPSGGPGRRGGPGGRGGPRGGGGGPRGRGGFGPYPHQHPHQHDAGEGAPSDEDLNGLEEAQLDNRPWDVDDDLYDDLDQPLPPSLPPPPRLRPIRDDEDGVYRCGFCLHEIWDGECTGPNCPAAGSDGSGSEGEAGPSSGPRIQRNAMAGPSSTRNIQENAVAGPSSGPRIQENAAAGPSNRRTRDNAAAGPSSRRGSQRNAAEGSSMTRDISTGAVYFPSPLIDDDSDDDSDGYESSFIDDDRPRRQPIAAAAAAAAAAAFGLGSDYSSGEDDFVSGPSRRWLEEGTQAVQETIVISSDEGGADEAGPSTAVRRGRRGRRGQRTRGARRIVDDDEEELEVEGDVRSVSDEEALGQVGSAGSDAPSSTDPTRPIIIDDDEGENYTDVPYAWEDDNEGGGAELEEGSDDEDGQEDVA